jgi:hypothetical protein
MAVLPNGLETVEPGVTSWRIIYNTNFENVFSKTEEPVYTTAGAGIILKDRSDGNTYRIYVENGTIKTEVV